MKLQIKHNLRQLLSVLQYRDLTVLSARVEPELHITALHDICNMTFMIWMCNSLHTDSTDLNPAPNEASTSLVET